MAARYNDNENVLNRADTNNDYLADLKTSPDHIEEVVIARLTEEDVFALSQESLRFKSWTSFRLALIMFVMGCNQAGYGIDWAVIGGINAYPAWHSYFGFGTSGATFGTINALMTIGTVCGAPFLALSDVIGRRGINFLGNAIVIASALLQGLAVNLPMFMAGRFFLGFGSALMSAPQYMGEVTPAHLRGLLVGLFGACFQVGSLGMNAALLGFNKMEGNWGWRIPLLLEALFPAIVCSTIYFIAPESPRYLITKGKKEQAKKMIARYHTTEGNNPDHPLVGVVVRQIEESLSNSPKNREVWDFRAFFKRGARYRVLVLILYSIFQQWNGGGIIGQYLVPALETIGITDSMKQLGFNFGSTAVYFVFTVFGSFIIDRFKRRTLIFAGLITFIVLQTCATITSWQYNLHKSDTQAALTVVWIFIFQACSATLIATMHNLYPVELLSLHLRAKGMALYGLVQGAAGTVNNYGISVGINKIGYKIWVVYIGYNCIQLVLSYFIFPETHGLTLEEMDAVFETPGVRPVKMSMDIQKAKKEKARMDAEGAQHGDL
ncbi:MFS sugar transporter-like protein [Rhexocercosporidium sp. MPI-PUGE-AT-0058]|nr:MFS sugar transporter-like protein [Rhexocercosporidium sp. MPI-PUGE-AT-0058]